MSKKKYPQASWYRVSVKRAGSPVFTVFRWDVLASDIDLAKQAALAELGEDYEVVAAIYMGGKSQYRRVYDAAYGFQTNSWRLSRG
uniref:hypothetical protein n=1 Tax=Flavobacterium sp. TaxID=239 RepID=UPI0040487CBA